MAYVPFQVYDPMESLDRSFRQFQQNMARSMAMGDAVIPVGSHAQAQAGYYRPLRHVPGQHSGISNVHVDKDCFKIELDVQQFSPDEIYVKTVDNHVLVEAKHEEKEDEHGFVARHFVRRYIIPEGVQADSISSTLSSDGLLTITAPMPKSTRGENERAVPIKTTGVPVNKESSGNTSKTTQEEKSTT